MKKLYDILIKKLYIFSVLFGLYLFAGNPDFFKALGDNEFLLSTLEVLYPIVGIVLVVSKSSNAMILGATFSASRSISLNLLNPSMAIFNSSAENLKKFTFASLTAALIKSVFPQPDGPNKINPPPDDSPEVCKIELVSVDTKKPT